MATLKYIHEFFAISLFKQCSLLTTVPLRVDSAKWLISNEWNRWRWRCPYRTTTGLWPRVHLLRKKPAAMLWGCSGSSAESPCRKEKKSLADNHGNESPWQWVLHPQASHPYWLQPHKRPWARASSKHLLGSWPTECQTTNVYRLRLPHLWGLTTHQ